MRKEHLARIIVQAIAKHCELGMSVETYNALEQRRPTVGASRFSVALDTSSVGHLHEGITPTVFPRMAIEATRSVSLLRMMQRMLLVAARAGLVHSRERTLGGARDLAKDAIECTLVALIASNSAMPQAHLAQWSDNNLVDEPLRLPVPADDRHDTDDSQAHIQENGRLGAETRLCHGGHRYME
jgi:hypothetical protein